MANKIKVGIDVSPLGSGHAGRGVGYYTKNLLAELKNDPRVSVNEFTSISDCPKVDIIHFTYFDFYQRTLNLNKKYPTIVTMHDITPLLFKEHFPPGIKGSLNLALQKISLSTVAGIATDSEYSKVDIIKHFKVDPKKVHVVYLAASEKFKVVTNKALLKEARLKYKLPNKFALFTGNVNWNKNLLNLTQACVDNGLDIVLIGRSFESRENLDHPELKSFNLFLKKFENHPLVHIRGFIENDFLPPIYSLATVFMFPSFYEGFGMPIIEAQATGTPVITSSLSCMPEVAGDGAILVDPYSISDLSRAVKRIMEDTNLRISLVQKGFKNAKRFNWKKSADQAIRAYEAILK